MCCEKLLELYFKKKSLYSTYSSFLVINVCNQGKNLWSPCISIVFHPATQISNHCRQVNSLAYVILHALPQIRITTDALSKKCRSLRRVSKDRGFENPLGAEMSESVYLKPLQLSDSPRSTLTAGISKITELKHHYSSQRLGSASSPHSSISRDRPLFCSVILSSISDTPTDQHKPIICLSINTT